LVERNLAKVEVESSRLFSRSKFFKEKSMGDPRSKNKAAKTKESKAPHQQIQKNTAMKNTAVQAPPQKVMRNTGRGR
jgi:hypothetical protein